MKVTSSSWGRQRWVCLVSRSLTFSPWWDPSSLPPHHDPPIPQVLWPCYLLPSADDGRGSGVGRRRTCFRNTLSEKWYKSLLTTPLFGEKSSHGHTLMQESLCERRNFITTEQSLLYFTYEIFKVSSTTPHIHRNSELTLLDVAKGDCCMITKSLRLFGFILQIYGSLIFV